MHWQTTPELLAIIAERIDDSAWRQIVERHQGVMFWTARMIIGSDADAEDAVQEALLVICRHAGRFRPRSDGDPPEGQARRWLLRITANCALNIRSREQNRRRHEARAISEAEAAIGVEDKNLDARDALRQALAAMDEPSRRPVVLHYMVGLDHQAMATEMGCSVVAARFRLQRALAKLRQRLVPAAALLTVAGLRLDASDALDGMRIAMLSPSEPHPFPANWLDLARSGLRPNLPLRQIFGGLSTMSKLSMLAAIAAAVVVTPLVAAHNPASQQGNSAESAAAELAPAAGQPGKVNGQTPQDVINYIAQHYPDARIWKFHVLNQQNGYVTKCEVTIIYATGLKKTIILQRAPTGAWTEVR